MQKVPTSGRDVFIGLLRSSCLSVARVASRRGEEGENGRGRIQHASRRLFSSFFVHQTNVKNLIGQLDLMNSSSHPSDWSATCHSKA